MFRDGTFKRGHPQKGPSSLTNKTKKYLKKYAYYALEE